LDEEFKKQRARTVRELAEKAIDPFIRRRLLDLALRYDGSIVPTPLTPIDLNPRAKGADQSNRVAFGQPKRFVAGVDSRYFANSLAAKKKPSRLRADF
jgi:hypothetical protein